MTPAIRATWLVCAALAGGAAAIAVSIATRTPARGAEAQDFWREIQPAATPRRARRIIVTYRLRRAVHRHVADRGWPDARDTNKSQAGSRASVPDPRSVLGGARPFAGAFVVRNAQVTPASDDADTFKRRALLPDPPRNLYVPPDLMERDQSLPIFTPPRERREPSDNRRRELCVAAVIVVAVLGGVASVAFQHNRGIVHA